MSFLAKLGDVLGGGLGQELVGLVRDHWPASMSDKDKAEMELLVQQFGHQKELELRELGLREEQMFNERTRELEGTAADLGHFGVLGRIVVFSRGMFRPVFAYYVAYLDWIWFATPTDFSEQQNTAMIAINIVVLVFFFGERAMRNLSPLITAAFSKN